MEKPEIAEVLAKAKALNLPEGLIVRSHDGRSFFLTKEEIERKTLTPETNATIAKIFEKVILEARPTAADNRNCTTMLHWLLTNDPFNEFWRGYSAIWASDC